MAASGMMREVVVAQSSSPPWKEIVVNTGASASTLQDIKVPDSCGGYTYRDSGLPGSPVRNRFIYWRTCGDVLELEESSLDLLLTGGRIRYRLQDTPIVGGVSVSESQGQVIILVATVASVHRLVFPHPSRRLQAEAFSLSEHIATSIFYDASLHTATDAKNMHMINPGGSIVAHLLSAASCVTADGEALFALGTNAGSIVLLKMPPVGISGVVIQHEMSHSSVIQKLWSGLGAIRGVQTASDSVVGVEIHVVRGETCIFALCRDLRLRIWSAKTRECIMTVSLLDMLTDRPASPPSTTGHMIKPVQSATVQSLAFCVYMSFPDRSHFVLLEPVVQDGRMNVQLHALLTQPAEDLIDFCVTGEQLVTLWTDSSGETIARAAALSEGAPTDEWRELFLEAPDTSEPLIPPNRDPRDFFLDRIFRPNEFSQQDIVRALSVYRRSHDSSLNPDALLLSLNLKEEVVSAVSLEIRNCASDYEMSEEAYYQLQMEQWGRFYSCCCQYRQVGSKLQGVFTDSVTGLVCLIRKSSLTYLRPCDQLERLYLCEQERITPNDLENIEFTAEGTSSHALCDDVHKLCQVLRLVQSELTEESGAQFVLDLQMLESPRELAERLVDITFFQDADLLSEIGSQLELKLQSVRNLSACLDLLLRLLNFQEMQEHQTMLDQSSIGATQQLSCSHLFTSPLATAVVGRTFEQICLTRLAMLRDLIIVQVLTLRLGERNQRAHGPAVCHSIKQELLPHYCNLVRCYVILYWSSQALTSTSSTFSLDGNMRRLASLEVSESGGFQATRQTVTPTTVLEAFVHGVGGTAARRQVAMTPDSDVQATWSHDLVALVHSLAVLMWPMSDETIFPEFLAGSCQYLALQEYVRLLRSLSVWNDLAAMFFLGLSHLYFDEPHKARHCFVSACDGIATETFLSQKLLQGAEGNHQHLTVLYYLKVIGQFEEYGMPDMVIDLANQAIRLADPDDPSVATLQSKVFKHQLELGHNQEAFTAMMANPDPSRRKDCLRQLVVVLSERGELQALVEFPYKDLEDEVVSVLESRARSVDLMSHNYYNLLYSFHVYRNNLHKAASVMFEHGLRLGREVSGVRALQRQAQCYLVAMNVLRLVQPEYAWVVKPVVQSLQVSMTQRRSPNKHTLDGQEKTPAHGSRKVEIMELKQLEKDYLLLDARLRLIRKNPDPALTSGPTASADEMVGNLVNNGLYDMAVIVCQSFGLQLHTVFSSLALRCVNLARCSSYYMVGDNNETAEAWEWLRENDVHASTLSRDSSATDHAWRLLQRYLQNFEETDARYHRCVCEKLLSQGFPLPAWLVNSYKAWSGPQLLRVYMDYDLLQPAAVLMMEYLEALVGVLQGTDSPAFGLKGLTYHSPMSVWVPYTCADQLLHALGKHQDDHSYYQLYGDVKNRITLYLNKVAELSEEVS